MSGIRGELDEHPANSNARDKSEGCKHDLEGERHTQQNYSNCDQNHKQMVVAEEWYEPLNANREPNVDHVRSRSRQAPCAIASCELAT